MEEAVKITTQAEALVFVDTIIRNNWETLTQTNPLLEGIELGEVAILTETQVEGHTAWSYTIEGLPVSRDGRKRWVLDTGETFDTTLNEDMNTPEKALAKQRELK